MNTDCSRISPVGQILLTALLQARHRLIKRELAERDGQVAGVVLDGRDIIDRLTQTTRLRVG
jgi:hypothetical protein